ncbi:Isoamyl acetate-hydrolyzing esterase [Hyphodiscus hymeniophilus]|uniref:Isoamyl acetate-hydrolyzing esterase n=1 Tax=Hyphodiscus hymeniophilus TaxID=353542 RepID=A0A9P7AVP7_9HELO|nr:Isoamyl acetate-hydrolyzing esterase [Hyphodiscus hymeniophilus]
MDITRRTPQFILLGDSLIQYTSYLTNGGYQFGSGLAERCIRRFDVVNRGYSGYNSSQILKILEHLIPSPSCVAVEFLLILLGSNDACLPFTQPPQHVPLQQYKENIKKILTHPCVAAHNPTILLVTPPPINEVHLEVEDLKKGHPALTRHQSVTSQYAEAIRELAAEFKDQKLLLVDLSVAMMKKAGRLTPDFVEGGALLGSKAAGDSPGLRSLLVDGLHLTGDGYALFLEEVMVLVADRMAERHADSKPWVFP